MDPLTSQFWIGIGVAMLCGGIVGFERQLRGKPAGIRTNILICLGTSIFVQLGATFSGPHVDPTRVLGQIATGIGFLGAGAIMRFGLTVKGLTSAASIWTIAAVGMAIGAGFYVASFVTMLILLLALHILEIVEDRLMGWTLYKKVSVVCARKPGMFENIRQVFSENHVRIYDWAMVDKIADSMIEYSATTRIRESVDVQRLLEDLGTLEGIAQIRIE